MRHSQLIENLIKLQINHKVSFNPNWKKNNPILVHWQPVSNGTSQICIEATKIRVVWSDTQILQSVQIHQDPRPPSHIYIVATKIRFVRDVSQNFQLYKFTKAIKLSMSSVIWLVKSNCQNLICQVISHWSGQSLQSCQS